MREARSTATLSYWATLFNKWLLQTSMCYQLLTLVLLALSLGGCTARPSAGASLEVVTHAQFAQFVAETGYVTDAEKFGWSIVQQDVFTFAKVEGANWRLPDGSNPPAAKHLPVTQVSYNDALAYCAWAGTLLPTYEQYWALVQDDHRLIVAQNSLPISPAHEVNAVGNVWEITATKVGEEVRLAGGSLFCSPSMCNGTSERRELYVDPQTGNTHIGFAVIKSY